MAVQQSANPEEHPGVLKRHIIIDNDNHVVYIQVMQAVNGNHIRREWDDIKQGRYHQYLPAEARAPVAEQVNNGYRVCPVKMDGQTNRDFYILQLTELRRKSVIIP